MNYRVFEEKDEFYFKYNPAKQKIKKFINKSQKSDNPFHILKNINFK